jgi:O-antigen ligase
MPSSVPLPLSVTAQTWRRRLLIAYVALLPVMVLSDLPLAGSKIQLTEIVFVALLGAWMVAALADPAALARTPLLRPLGVWMLIAALSTTRALHVRASALELASWLYLALVYVVIATSVGSWDDWRRIVVAWVIASSVTAGLVIAGAAAGYLWGLPTPFAVRYEPYSVLPRPVWAGVGLMWASPTPNMIAGYLLAGAVFALGLFGAAPGVRSRWLAGAAVAVHAAAFGLTISRVAIAAGFALLVFLLRFRSYGAEITRWGLLVAWLAFTLIVETVSVVQPARITTGITRVEEPAASTYRAQHFGHLRDEAPVQRLVIESIYAPFSRPLLYRAAVRMWSERPWLGIGPGGFATELFTRQQSGEGWDGLKVQAPWDPHTTYLGALAEIGALGLLSVLVLLAMLVGRTAQAARRTRGLPVAPIVWAVLACVAGYVLAAVDDDVLTKRWLWGVGGLAGSAWLLSRPTSA